MPFFDLAIAFPQTKLNMKKYTIWILGCLLFITSSIKGQQSENWNSGEIYEALKKLNFLGSVLYVAAHPDDENTRMISYLSNHIKARTAYLSLTRGDGGQNLIGPEIRELLGVIRTQELLAARRIDGGEQFFSRANDFGYSKHPDETVSIWDDEDVMSDVVWSIRKYRPDVIINRFDHKSAGRTHGHHTASAVLSFDAHDLSGDKTKFPEQLDYVEPYTARRLFFNTSWWFYGSREAFAKADKSDMVSMDIGIYYPTLGTSNSEIAALSRSQHVCQGMGNTARRGSSMEYLQLLKGDMPQSESDIFQGINTTWSRIPGGAPITDMVASIIDDFNFVDPTQSVAPLLKVYAAIEKLPENHWKNVKLEETRKLISACMGLFLEAVTDQHTTTIGDSIDIAIESTNRSNLSAQLDKIEILPYGDVIELNKSLAPNQEVKDFRKIAISESINLTSPYWLKEKGSLGMYKVANQEMIGLAETPRELKIKLHTTIDGQAVTFTEDIQYKYNSPEAGPVYRPLEVVPELFVKPAANSMIFTAGHTKDLSVTLKAGSDNQSGTLKLPLPEGWKSTPEFHEFNIKNKGAEQTLNFSITPPSFQSIVQVKPVAETALGTYDEEGISINYPHIPYQFVMRDADIKLVNIDVNITGNHIAYIQGAGDDIPASLRQIGYNVDELEVGEITPSKISDYHAIIMGIRAYNKWDEMRFKQPILLDYVEKGGTLVVQYNTSRRIKTDQLGPYPLKLSRDRVTVEEAEVRILQPDHPALTTPNKITDKDFNDWVQERGLYFSNEWSEEYTALLSSNDPGESPKDGGLLVAPYGNGWYVYTGYSFFRELPAGVPGAYRLLANLISLGSQVRP